MFYLGTHLPNWVARDDIRVPLFISRRRLTTYRTLPRAVTNWALDSGGFTELSMHGSWQTSSETYVMEVRRFMQEVGKMDYAAPQDWMCEPMILNQTGLSVRDHQERTVSNYLDLKYQAPEIPWMPVIQGWDENDYLSCVDQYERVGVDLTQEPIVGLGTVCRRQATKEVERIVWTLSDLGIRIHGFGIKLSGLRAVSSALGAADSMAWSYNARHDRPIPGCTHKNCANCHIYALRWREKVLNAIQEGGMTPRQLVFGLSESPPISENRPSVEKQGQGST